MASPPPRVCVTGGGGYIGSWLVRLLLSRGYAVHATLRDPCDPKNAHLKRLDGASEPERLRLFKADVLDSDELSVAIAGCEGVFHVASPVPGDKVVDPESEVMAPAVKGTLNVLQVCSSRKVQKVVVVSSTSAVHFNPNWPQGKPKDENCWSDRKLCMDNENWYHVSKIVAERTALEYAEKTGLNIVTVCPCLVFGPQLQPTVNTSNELLIYVTKGGPTVMKNILYHIVDVRDVAEALLLVYEKPESYGRYLCAPDHISTKAMVEFLKSMYPNYNYVKCSADADIFTPISSEKLKNLGWQPRKLEETLVDSIEYYEKEGILQDADGKSCVLPYLFRFAVEN
ncbi:cinnamoyl-CoA reductase 1-like [Oryza brachyantha]|nr:cinnamoyl-CoA reductase 1-like [Oryza brachyantha]